MNELGHAKATLDAQRPTAVNLAWATERVLRHAAGLASEDASVVRAAVLSGTDRANAEFSTSWHPLEIRFSYSGYDNERCSLAGSAAYNIVRALAEGTVAAD